MEIKIKLSKIDEQVMAHSFVDVRAEIKAIVARNVAGYKSRLAEHQIKALNSDQDAVVAGFFDDKDYKNAAQKETEKKAAIAAQKEAAKKEAAEKEAAAQEA